MKGQLELNGRTLALRWTVGAARVVEECLGKDAISDLGAILKKPGAREIAALIFGMSHAYDAATDEFAPSVSRGFIDAHLTFEKLPEAMAAVVVAIESAAAKMPKGAAGKKERAGAAE